MASEQARNPDGTPMTLLGKPVYISDSPELAEASKALEGATLMSLEQWRAKKMTQPREEGKLPMRTMGDVRA